MISAVTALTVTRVTVDLVFTGPSVLTGTAVTLVDVCGGKIHTVSLEVRMKLTQFQWTWGNNSHSFVGGGNKTHTVSMAMGIKPIKMLRKKEKQK